MELTPKVLTTVEFAEKRRGYDPDEVRAFLGEVARAMDGLQQRVRDAETRLAEMRRGAAASPVPPPAPVVHDAEELAEQARRTLVLAQRTADAAMAEAREEAERTRASADADARATTERAQSFAQRALGDAQARAAQLIADTEVQVRAESEELRNALRDEIAGLTAARDTLRGDVERMEAFLSAQRERVRICVDALQHVIDHPEAMSANEIPVDTPVSVPGPVPARSATPPPVPPPTDALEPPLPLADEAESDELRHGESGGDGLEATQAMPVMAATQGGASDASLDATPAGGIARPGNEANGAPEPSERSTASDPDRSSAGSDSTRAAADQPTVAIGRPPVTPERADPLLPVAEPDPFDDEQLVRSFFEPKREHGQSRRRRRRD